jgi:uncharacterized membrane protein YkvA (DUF1232 family)
MNDTLVETNQTGRAEATGELGKQLGPDLNPAQAARARSPAAAPFPTSDSGDLLHGALDLLFRRLGLKYFAGLISRRDSIEQEVERIPARMQRVTNQARLLLERLDDFRTGSYRVLSWGSIALTAGALLYTVSPADVIPDAIPGLGSLDDLLVIAVALRVIRRDLEAYCQFKGYDPAAYF